MKVVEYITLIGSSLLILLGLNILLGIQFETNFIYMKSSYQSVEYLGAFCFTISGVITTLLIFKNLKISRYLAILIISISTITLCEYIFHFDFTLKEYLFNDTNPDKQHLMPLNSTISFIIFSIFVLIEEKADKLRDFISIWIIFFIFSLSTLSLFAYILELKNAYTWLQFIDISLSTAIGFFILSIISFSYLLLKELRKKVPKDKLFLNKFVAWFIFILSLIMTIISWSLSNYYADKNAKESFYFEVEDAKKRIVERMKTYEQVLKGGIGLFQSSENVTRDEWKEYIYNLDINIYYKGIQGIGYAQMIQPSELKSFEAKIEADGFENFHINPQGIRDMYSAIVFLEPMDSRNEKAFGYDMYSNEIRREAMDTARDTGMTTISRRVVLVQEIDNSDIQAGFLMYLPLYQKGADSTTLESRKDSLRGFVYSPFRANDLLDGLLGDTFQTLSMRIYDSNILEDDYLLYDSISKKSRLNTNAIFKDTITLELQNRTWSIEFFSTPHFESLINSSQPAIVGFVGFTIDIILFFMVHFLIKTKSDLEEQQELLISQSRLSAMGEMIGNIAHQWRQPLNSINLGIYIIDELVDEASEKHKLEDCQIKDYTKSILDTTEYLSKTIDEFRNFFETKQERENFTVSTVINDTISLLSPQFKAVNITISFTNISTYETIYSYSTKFKQVLLNILNNSKDAILMEQKENRVNIGMIHITLSEDENSIIIEIEDNGGGIDSDIIDKIYEPYFTTKFASRGKGLGLYMSKMIIERHMFGTLSSKNKENGSIFIIKIPILNKT